MKRTWAIFGDHIVNDGSFDTVYDIVARAGYKMAVGADLYFLLYTDSRLAFGTTMGQGGRKPYIMGVFLLQALVLVFPVTGHDPAEMSDSPLLMRKVCLS